MNTPTSSSIASPTIKLTPKQVDEKIDIFSKIRNTIQNQANIVLKFLK